MGGRGGRLEINPKLFVSQMKKLRLRVGWYHQGCKGVNGKAEPPDPGRKGSHRMWLPSPTSPPWSKRIWAKWPPRGQSVKTGQHHQQSWSCGSVLCPSLACGFSIPICDIRFVEADANALKLIPPTLARPQPISWKSFPEDPTLGPEIGTYIKIAHI